MCDIMHIAPYIVIFMLPESNKKLKKKLKLLLTLPYKYICAAGTSDGGYGSHSVSLPKNLIKTKVKQMLPSSYTSSLLVSFS